MRDIPDRGLRAALQLSREEEKIRYTLGGRTGYNTGLLYYFGLPQDYRGGKLKKREEEKEEEDKAKQRWEV